MPSTIYYPVSPPLFITLYTRHYLLPCFHSTFYYPVSPPLFITLFRLHYLLPSNVHASERVSQRVPHRFLTDRTPTYVARVRAHVLKIDIKILILIRSK